MQTNQQLNKPKFFRRPRDSLRRASTRQRITAAIVCLAVAALFGLLWAAGHYKIDVGRWLGPCGFKQRTGLPCPTCGVTTAVLTFARGRIFEAFYIQPAAALLCCVLVVAAVLALVVAVFGVYFGFLERFFSEVKARHIILALLIIIAAGWAVTLARALAAGN